MNEKRPSKDNRKDHPTKNKQTNKQADINIKGVLKKERPEKT